MLWRRCGATALAVSMALLCAGMGTVRAQDSSGGGATAAGAAAGDAPAAKGARANRPRLALVMSGGGARGAAHIGVLRVLEELHVHPDLIVGTSMGSIIGGLYAAGYSPDQLEELLKSTDWKDVFVDAVERRDRSFRRKGDDATFLIPGKLRFKGFRPYIPPSIFGGQQLELLLRSLEMAVQTSPSFDDFPIPYRAVALDLGSGEAVILDKGSLATAMRASMSVPGMFSPVKLDGKLLVDGGEVANLPIGIAQSLGAQSIIAVDITSPLITSEEIDTLFSVMNQWSSFSAVANRVADIKKLRPGDVLITPELKDIGFISFDKVNDAMAIGEQSARAVTEGLKRFSAPPAEWDEFVKHHRRRNVEKVKVDEVTFTNSSWVNDRIIDRRLRIPEGKSVDIDDFNNEVMRLYGLDYFGLIRPTYIRQDGKGTINLDIPAKPYGRNSLQFGASFWDDFHGDANYTFSFRHLLIAANRRGGEWENVAQIGQTRLLRTSFYQPIDYKMRWFVSPTAETKRDYVYLWADGDRVSEESISTLGGSLDVGRVIGDNWEVRLGAFYAHNTTSTSIGPNIFVGDEDERDGGGQFKLNVDSRDSTVFPRHGAEVHGFYRHSTESMGADADRDLARLDASLALTLGRVTVVPSFSGQTLVTGPVSFISSCALGGFLNLSGLGFGELRAERCVVGRAISYVQLTRFDLGPLTSAVYGGISFEAGNAYFRDDPVTWQSLTMGGSLFFGAQTPLGPAFFAWGTTETGEHKVYFVIGDRF
ncbi:MAG TPA: patatin-like phospholipase family protein [Candidatus Polarisedimenticolia bacterium]|nr:patatin-like phospholipase family protein [Candidatus Polarisedimenticolia bacterium]